MSEQNNRELFEVGSLFEMGCQWSVGPLMDQFYAGFEKKKILGSKCPECDKIYVPPREVCSDCWTPMSQLTELPETGKVVNFTVAHVDVKGARRDKPIAIGLVKLDGAYTAMFGQIEGISPDDVKVGLKVKAVWAEQTKGHVKDLHFEPV